MMRRALLVLGMTLAVLASESLAAWVAWVDESQVHLVQAWLALVFGLALYLVPLPARWLPVVPLALAGWRHIARVGLGPTGQWTGAASMAVLLHLLLTIAIVVWALRRARGPEGTKTPFARERTLAVFSVAYLAQAAAVAWLLFPSGLTPFSGRLPLTLVATTLLPLLSAGAVASAVRPRARPARGRAMVGTACTALACVLLPALVSGPLAFRLHRELPGPRPAVSEHPDVLLVVLDTTRADRLSLHGYARATSPRLQEFASGATVFENAVSQAIWTLPSHASLFTGLYPREHHADRSTPLARQAVTQAEWFREAGYRTAAVAANQMFRIDAGYGLGQGFELMWCEEPKPAYLLLPGSLRWLAVRLKFLLPDGSVRALDERLRPAQPALRERLMPARSVARVARSWWRRVGDAAPRYLFVNLMEAHGMARAHRCGAPVFGDGVAFSRYETEHFQRVQAGLEDASPEDLKRLGDWYDSSLACMDLHLGELFDALRDDGLFDDMLIAVVADHGEMLGDQRSFGHRGEVWDGLAHVPLLVKAPGQREGLRCAEPIETLSLAAALPELAGLEPLAELPTHVGEAGFVPAFIASTRLQAVPERGDALERLCGLPRRRLRPLVTSEESTGQSYDLNERWHRTWLGIRDGDAKLMRNSDGEVWVSHPTEGAPEEASPAGPEESERLAELLQAWEAQRLELESANPASGGDEARQAVLRRLGYAE